MEFKEFAKNQQRMCSETSCADCPFSSYSNSICSDFILSNPDEAEKIVKEWTDEHLLITNRDKFKEVFGVHVPSFLQKEWLDEEYKPVR